MNEPVGPLAGKVIKVVPHVPYYMADGNTVNRKWQEDFTDRVGNEAVLTLVEFTTKKGKHNTAVIQVKWK